MGTWHPEGVHFTVRALGGSSESHCRVNSSANSHYSQECCCHNLWLDYAACFDAELCRTTSLARGQPPGSYGHPFSCGSMGFLVASTRQALRWSVSGEVRVAVTNRMCLAHFLVAGGLPSQFLVLQASTDGAFGECRVRHLTRRCQIWNRGARWAFKTDGSLIR